MDMIQKDTIEKAMMLMALIQMVTILKVMIDLASIQKTYQEWDLVEMNLMKKDFTKIQDWMFGDSIGLVTILTE